MISIISLICALITSALFCLFIIIFNRHHIHLSGDDNFHLPQKIHTEPIPRVGGVAIFMGLLVGVLIQKASSYNIQTLIIACAAPAFLIGTYEDITKKISPHIRLIFIGVSAILEIYFNDVLIIDIGIPALSPLVQFQPFSIFFTTFALIGLTNAYNISDGLNGLSSLLSLSALLAIFIVSTLVDDSLLAYLSLLIASSILGFIIFNFPYGRIFLGDGGAYLIGILTALMSILLVTRNQEVSPFVAIVLNLYPIIETLFSMHRRVLDSSSSMTSADNDHMHSLIYIKATTFRWSLNKNFLNPLAALIVLFPSFIASTLAIYFYNSSLALFLIFLIYFLSYLCCYKKLSQLKKA